MNDWREVTLDELGRVERGRSRHRPRNDPRLYGGSTPFFQTGDVKAAVLHLTEATQYYSEAGLAQSRLWQPGTTCVTIAANIAETAVLGVPGCFPDSVLGFSPHSDPEDAYFVKYLLDVERKRLSAAARGTTQENLSLEKLGKHQFRVPTPAVRRVIVRVLRALDDLIENNGRRIALLERLAQAIYREWFVHFRYPGHEDDELVDSPLGPIPAGWEVQPLKDLASIVMGQSPKSEHYNAAGDGLPFHQGVSNFGSNYPRHRLYCRIDGRMAQAGDHLVSVRAPVGRLNRADQRLVIGRGLAAVRSRGGYQALLGRQLGEVFHEDDVMGGGTIFKAITKGDLEGVQIVRPADGVGRLAEAVLEPIDSLIRGLTFGERALEGLRDRLLPKLVTGAIDVSHLDLDGLLEAPAA